MAINKLSKKLIGAAMAVSVAFFGSVVLADELDVTIKYGSNITEDMESVVRSIEKDGLSVVATADLDDPYCLAIIKDGKELYRFTEERVISGDFTAIAALVGLGERISKRTKSDCPTSVVLLGYGKNIVDVENIARSVRSSGISVTVRAGYANDDCGQVTIGEVALQCDQDEVDNGRLGAYIQRFVEGKKIRPSRAPSCDADKSESN